MGFWVFIQGFALFCILFTPLYFNQASGKKAGKEPPGIRDPETSQSQENERRGTLKSAVLELFPKDHEMWGQHPHIFVSMTRQVRFEFHEFGLVERKSPKSEDPRGPASLKEEWKVVGISREIEDGEWEDLSLILNENGVPISSTFVELFKAKNKFKLEFNNPKIQDSYVREFVVYSDKP